MSIVKTPAEFTASNWRHFPSKKLGADGTSLSGVTLLRFAHAFDSGGGTESYLDDIDRALLERNAMTILRLHITRAGSGEPPEEMLMGRGKLIRIRLPVVSDAGAACSAAENSVRFRFKQKLRDWILYNPVVWHTVGARWAAAVHLHPRPGEAIGAGIAAAAAMSAHRFDLAMLHFFGGADTDEIIAQARSHCVPFGLLNHYSNDRFLHLAIRKHAMLADSVAGVNGLQVPRYLQRRFTNLSDGIDTEFFRREKSVTIPDLPAEPIVLLPARVTREKGHIDLVRAAATLRDRGIKCTLVFAGRVDNQEFLDELRNEIVRQQLSESVRFLGAISVPVLRDWYAASTLVAFPTYHHEGLPRVIIEAQAMGTAVVAYATGGVPDAIVSGATGQLVSTGDIAELAKRVCDLLSSSELRSSIAIRGRRAAEQQFSLTALAERHEAFYLGILAKARRIGGGSSAGTSPLRSTV